MNCHSKCHKGNGFFSRFIKRRMQRRVDRLADKLELTHVQKNEFDGLLALLIETRGTFWETRSSLRSELGSMLRSSETGAGWLADQVKESVNEVKKQADDVAEKLSGFVETLNMSQRETLAGMLERRGRCGC